MIWWYSFIASKLEIFVIGWNKGKRSRNKQLLTIFKHSLFIVNYVLYFTNLLWNCLVLINSRDMWHFSLDNNLNVSFLIGPYSPQTIVYFSSTVWCLMWTILNGRYGFIYEVYYIAKFEKMTKINKVTFWTIFIHIYLMKYFSFLICYICQQGYYK